VAQPFALSAKKPAEELSFAVVSMHLEMPEIFSRGKHEDSLKIICLIT